MTPSTKMPKKVIISISKAEAIIMLKQRWMGKYGYSDSYDFINKNYIQDFDYFYLIHHHTCKDVKKFYHRLLKLGLHNEIMLKGEDRIVSTNIDLPVKYYLTERVEFT